MLLLRLYRLATDLSGPAVAYLLRRRLAQGKEDPDRISERYGQASLPRPEGTVVWVHAASVGESQSSLALIELLLAARPDIHVLQTTGTLTSARLMSSRLPPRSFHQFVPLDRLSWVRRFLDHWKPDLALWMESELWPNLVRETARRNIPSALVNARMSERTYRRWRWLSGTARTLLSKFSVCLAQSEEQAEFLRRLGAPSVKCLGNLKFSAAALPVDDRELARMRDLIEDRPVWLAASTHDGEEKVAAAVHQRLVADWPDLLTIVVPRHPARAAEIQRTLQACGLATARRSENAELDADVYIADTLGELGLFYRLSKIAYIGGSMAAYGGHNPLEAAQLDSAIIHGPDMSNFKTVAQQLADAQAALQIDDAEGLSAAVSEMLRNPEVRDASAASALRVAEENADAVVRIGDEIARLMNGV